MEQRFGYDFSQVRVHSDPEAAESARAVNALAYTSGQNIVFDASRFAPTTHDGQRLLVHELAHTIQQRDASGPLLSADSREILETSANAAERDVARAGFLSRNLPASGLQIQRKPGPDVRRKTNVGAARYRGKLMAERVRRHGKLSQDAQAKMNQELAYFEGAAKDAYMREIKPVLVTFVGIEMPEMNLRPEPVKPVRTEQEREYEAMVAYHASTRESQLDAAQAAHETFRQGVHVLTPRQIHAQWDDEKENFLAVASSTDHRLNAEQLLEIYKL